MNLAQKNSTEGNQDDMFLEITEADVPNLANLTDSAKEVFESGSGVPIAVNSIVIVYDKEKVGHEITSWEDLWSEDLKGQISIPDITVTAGSLMLYVASDYVKQDMLKNYWHVGLGTDGPSSGNTLDLPRCECLLIFIKHRNMIEDCSQLTRLSP